MPLLIVGLSGASWEVLEPAMERGDMPNLAALARSGSRGNVRAHLPTYLRPNWASFWTGVHPGRHLIGASAALDRAGVRSRVATSADLRFPTWPDILRAGDIAVETLNATLLPRRGHSFNADDTYFPSGGIADDEARAEFVGRHLENLEATYHRAIEVVRANRPAVMLVDLRSLDRLLHALWGGLEHPTSPGGRSLSLVLARLDDHLGVLVGVLEPEAVMLFSGHGMASCRAVLNLAPALVDSGALQLQPARRMTFGRLRGSPAFAVVRRGLAGVVRRGGCTRQLTQRWRLAETGSPVYLDDKALYVYGGTPATSHLCRELESLVDPATSEAPIAKAWDARELYGSLDSDLGVILPEPTAGYTLRTGGIGHEATLEIRPWRDYLAGTHTATGMWLLSPTDPGPALRNAAIEDFAPALLTHFGLTVPPAMSGRAEAVLGDARV